MPGSQYPADEPQFTVSDFDPQAKLILSLSLGPFMFEQHKVLCKSHQLQYTH